jgi:general transcription factor IIIA
LTWLTAAIDYDPSGHESLDSQSSADSVDELDRSAPTPLTPISSKASPGHPSDLYKSHHCPYEGCKKSFNRPAKLAQHLRSHTNTRPFVCPYSPCTKDFLRESHLNHHVRSAHSNVRDYVCEWEGCGKSFLTATRLRRHHAAHEGREKFRCTFTGCGQKFRKHGTLQKHITIVHEGRSPFTCEAVNHNGNICDAGFDTEGKLKSHAARVHGARTFLCTICSLEENEIKPKDISGEIGPAYPTHAALQAHIASEHPPTCAECGLKCTSQSALKSHVEVIHGGRGVDERRIHVCPEAECGRAFTKKGNLHAHIQISHVGKRFVCGVVDVKTMNHIEDWDGSNACGEASTSKRNLERHIRTAHLGLEDFGKSRKKEKRGSLDQPAQKNQVSTLTRLTGSGYEDESGRNITCLIQDCDHRFYREYDLEIHLQSRHGLADLEVQEVLEEGKLYGRSSLQGAPIFATEQDIEAEKAFDRKFGKDVAMDDFDESLEGGGLKDGGFWLGGQFYQTITGRDEVLRDDLGMKQMIDEDHEWANVEMGVTHDVDMIDPSLR